MQPTAVYNAGDPIIYQGKLDGRLVNADPGTGRLERAVGRGRPDAAGAPDRAVTTICNAGDRVT